MAREILGVDIGSRRVKLCLLRNGEIVQTALLDTPENAVRNDSLTAYEAMGSLLREGMKENGIHCRRAAVVIPDPDAYMHRLSMPLMTEKQLAVNLPYEFHDVITDNKDHYLYDYAMISSHEKQGDQPGEMELMAGAVSKEKIEAYQEMFHHAGMKLVMAAPRQMALVSVLRAFADTCGHGDVALVDLGDAFTRVDLFRDGTYEATRTIDTGVSSIVSAIGDVLNVDPHVAHGYLFNDQDKVLESEALANVYNVIAVEIMRAINYYTYENQNNTLEKLYVYGGGSHIKGLVASIADSLSSLQVVPVDAMDMNAPKELEDQLVSFGIAREAA
ncbi:MAG: pilus assembly protein PilM [Lactimicrobium sp.]|jgi:type IV pilus assembly protein PilM|uniref:pilus assembly protein PilM n=1 Tax=Lactimicrobium sp. TaxID=2563780 RepID=UPI002F35DD09